MAVAPAMRGAVARELVDEVATVVGARQGIAHGALGERRGTRQLAIGSTFATPAPSTTEDDTMLRQRAAYHRRCSGAPAASVNTASARLASSATASHALSRSRRRVTARQTSRASTLMPTTIGAAGECSRRV